MAGQAAKNSVVHSPGFQLTTDFKKLAVLSRVSSNLPAAAGLAVTFVQQMCSQ